MAKQVFDADLFWICGVCGLVLGVIVGFPISYWLVRETAHALVTQDELKRDCLSGNDRACSIYEVDYGR